MTNKIIAVVKLAPGNIGWYDELTGIHLTIARPTANVYSGKNTTNLTKALRERVIGLVSGSLIEGNQEPTINSTPLNTMVVEIIEEASKAKATKKVTKTSSKVKTTTKRASKTKTK